MTVETAVGKPIVVTDASFAKDVLASPVLVAVDFWAPWCPPCRLIAPFLNELAAEYAGRLTIAKLTWTTTSATWCSWVCRARRR